MRHLKIRVWDKELQRMVKWEDLKFDKDEGENFICFYGKEIGYNSIWEESLDNIVMFYTGLEDIKGEDIYEGDVLESFGTHKLRVYIEYGHVRIVFYDLGEKIDDLLFQENIDLDSLEIIGNVYENEDLKGL